MPAMLFSNASRKRVRYFERLNGSKLGAMACSSASVETCLLVSGRGRREPRRRSTACVKYERSASHVDRELLPSWHKSE